MFPRKNLKKNLFVLKKRYFDEVYLIICLITTNYTHPTPSHEQNTLSFMALLSFPLHK